MGISILDEDPPGGDLVWIAGFPFPRLFRTDETDEVYARVTLINHMSEKVSNYISNTWEGVINTGGGV